LSGGWPLIRALPILAAALLAIAAGYVAASDLGAVWSNPDITKIDRHHEPSAVIFPTQQIPLRFFHDKHLALEMECETCHEDIAGSVRASDRNIPGGQVCALCHDVADKDPAKAEPASACATCHLGYAASYSGTDPHDHPDSVADKPARMVIPDPNLKFNHKVHLDRKIACQTCHGDLSKIAVAAPGNALPVMGTCIDCHDGKQAPDACGTCHITDPSSRIVTELPQGKLKPHGHYRSDAHDDDFVRNHAHVARTDEGYCASCHQQSDCTDCHNGIVKPVQIHPANWILTHPTTARKSSLECTSCHMEQNFCLDCHTRTGISLGTQAQDTKVLFHPEGWVNSPGQLPSGSHHMFQAQRNIRTCVSCHEERTCLECHSAKGEPGFGVGKARQVNPHPVDFRSRCKTMMKTNDRSCLKCHSPSDPDLLLCR
jgi:hypothetical protein